MRTAADLVRDAIATNEAHATYSEAQGRLLSVARDLVASGSPLTGSIYRHNAYIAQRAARAELLDPDRAEPPACSICGRVRSCLAVQ